MKKTKETEQELNFAITTPSGIDITSLVDWDKTFSNSKWVKWGYDNKMPLILWDNYLKCSLLSSIINRMTDYTFGNGIELIDTATPLTDTDDNFSDVVKKVIFDSILFGGFTIECIRNAKGDIVRYNYQNIMNVRVNESLTTAYISNKWNQYSTSKYVELPLYNKNEKQPHFLFYYRGNITRGINPIPCYVSALKSIEILNQTRNFHKNNLRNGFCSSVIVNLNNTNIKTRELDEIKRKLEEGYTGTENAGKFILLNGGDRQHSASIERLDADNFGDLYMSLDESSKEDLYTAFGINPMLLGKNENTGFAREEFENAYKLFYTTTIKPIQDDVQKQFQKIGISFIWKPFVINWGD